MRSPSPPPPPAPVTLTAALLAAHTAQGEAISAAIEKLALDILTATGKRDQVSPYQGERQNDVWGFSGWEVMGTDIHVSFEFQSQSPDSYGMRIPLSYLSR